jgi:hypothetical protein
LRSASFCSALAPVRPLSETACLAWRADKLRRYSCADRFGFYIDYALILKKVSGPRSNKHLDSKDVALRQILIQAPTKRAVTQMHAPNFAH